MRIRKHPGPLFASLERPRRSTNSCIAISTGHGFNGGDERFLLPLVAAIMDVQHAEDKEGGGDHGAHTRPAHNWRNALHQQSCSEGNSKSQALQNGAEGRKPYWRWNRSVRSQWDNNIALFTDSETHRVFLMNEDTSSSAEKETTRGRDEEWKLQQKNLSLQSVKPKRSKNEIGYFKGLKDDEKKTSKRVRQETYIEQEDGRKVDDKTTPNKRFNNNNETEGSQCRRRNGRGWRCSQRTLVGYSLCEHHLGKGRLRSINSNSTVTVNTKAGTCKLKKLRLINASS